MHQQLWRSICDKKTHIFLSIKTCFRRIITEFQKLCLKMQTNLHTTNLEQKKISDLKLALQLNTTSDHD